MKSLGSSSNYLQPGLYLRLEGAMTVEALAYCLACALALVHLRC